MKNHFRIIFVISALCVFFSASAQASSFSVSINSNQYGNHKHWKKHNYGGHHWHHKKIVYVPVYYQPYPPPQVVYVQSQPVQQVIFASNVPGYQNDNGQYCREYNALVYVGGQKQSGYGTACYQPDGSWKIID